MGTEQTFLRDGRWLTMSQVKQLNKKTKVKEVEVPKVEEVEVEVPKESLTEVKTKSKKNNK